jgi:GTP-binding protein EngB required for normal cell division
MATLPVASFSEVAFIGRSNVGKSSLINMLTNRKKLAYTSKTPGKTSEFNYFEIQSVVGVDKAKSSFYIGEN